MVKTVITAAATSSNDTRLSETEISQGVVDFGHTSICLTPSDTVRITLPISIKTAATNNHIATVAAREAGCFLIIELAYQITYPIRRKGTASCNYIAYYL